jgi:hypothetical protein
LNDLAKDLFCAIFCHVYINYRKKICFFCFCQSYFFLNADYLRILSNAIIKNMLIQEHKKEIFLFFNHIDLDKFTCCCIN